ncbi:MAG TPA: T9SS C-terminal target domain-containing protein, partial [Bacteroidetes bacterium]|nr:T9SS C-terminal target domain-containing protein [Bacteroidota bacterium]
SSKPQMAATCWGGHSGSNMNGDKTEANLGGQDYWVVKLDPFGNIQWQNTIGGNYNDFLKSIIQSSDGGYLLGGYSESDISGDKTEDSSFSLSDYWVVKLDEAGNILWENTIGAATNDFLNCVIQTTDGGYMLGGYSNSGISGDKTEVSWLSDYWVLKLDEAGNIEWQNTIAGGHADYLNSIIQTDDGGYLLGGVFFIRYLG